MQASIHERPDVVKAFAGMHSLLQQQLDPHALLRALETIFPGRPLPVLRQRALDLQRMDPAVWEPVLADKLCAGLPAPDQWPHISAPVHLLMADPTRGAALVAGDEAAIAQRCAQLTSECIQGAGHRIHHKFKDLVADRCLRLLQIIG